MYVLCTSLLRNRCIFPAHFVKGWLDCIMHIHLLMVGHLYSKTFPQKCLIAADHDVGHHLWCKQTCSLGATSRSYFDKIRSGLRIWKDYDDCNTTTSLWEKNNLSLKALKMRGGCRGSFYLDESLKGLLGGVLLPLRLFGTRWADSLGGSVSNDALPAFIFVFVCHWYLSSSFSCTRWLDCDLLGLLNNLTVPSILVKFIVIKNEK